MTDLDPISSENTPNKRRRLNDNSYTGSSEEEHEFSDDEITEEDFHTVATLPATKTYAGQQTSITQPTQTLNLNSQPFRLEDERFEQQNTSDILVERSSPVPSPKPPPRIIRPFARPSLLASSIAPAGTAFRAPFGVQSKPQAVPISDDSDEDPPIYHSSDEEDKDKPRGLTSSLKPTNFRSSRQEHRSLIEESPRVPSGSAASLDHFKNLVSSFNHGSKVADDSVSAYASSRSKPQQRTNPAVPTSRPHKSTAVRYKHIADIDDYVLRTKVGQIIKLLPSTSLDSCVDALAKNHNNVMDAVAWLTTDESSNVPEVYETGGMDELASTSPVARRGATKQEIRPIQTIAERYASKSGGVRASQLSSPEEENFKPRRLLPGRRPNRSTSPVAPVTPIIRKPSQDEPRQPLVIDVDSGSEGGEADPSIDEFDHRLLRFFNDCTISDLVDLSTQTEEVASLILEHRPFRSLEAIRAISRNNTKKSSRTRNIGERVVDVCYEMLQGYEAVDELVQKCEIIAKPIKESLKRWGVQNIKDGELQLMHFEANPNDSGIGTPSSAAGEDGGANTIRGRFLKQPSNMNREIKMKDYQLVGLNWLDLLWNKRLSCLLCDEMGLGKTCQVIAFLAHLQESENIDGVHLVVVPGSTLENWLREFERFAPSLKVAPYYGSQAERNQLQADIAQRIEDNELDVVVTTYDMAQRRDDDNKFLRHLHPTVCVFDEAHALKNPQSERYRNLTRIPATFRVLLTGTPLQNNLQELVAMLSFILPDMFHAKRNDLQFIFKHKASTTGDTAAFLSSERIARARTMITPFVLRRKKEQVLDLPAKISRVEYCDMVSSQAEFYQELIQDAHRLLSEGSTTGKKKGKKKIGASSNILMELRKAAIHPLLSLRLYDDTRIEKIVTELLKHDEFSQNTREKTKQYLTGDHHQSFKGGDYGLHCFCEERPYLRKYALKRKELLQSGKVAKFREIMQRLVSNGDRVLVFSQFTSMMDILEAVLHDLAVKFKRLDGSTSIQVRQTMIDEFYEDQSFSVFMLSTKAGGAGINLACANKVIIFDSGFNPQEDVQASNRCHRVGQTREVEIIRLVTRGTIEEQILALGEAKLALDERVAGEEDPQAEKTGEALVEQMLKDSMIGDAKTTLKTDTKAKRKSSAGANANDLKDDFKSALEDTGLNIASKQAQF